MYEDNLVLIDGRIVYKPLEQDEIIEGKAYWIVNYSSNDVIMTIATDECEFKTALSTSILFDREYKARLMIEYIKSCVQKIKVND